MLSYSTVWPVCVHIFIIEFALCSGLFLSDLEKHQQPWTRFTVQLLGAVRWLLFRLMTFRQHQDVYTDVGDGDIRPRDKQSRHLAHVRYQGYPEGTFLLLFTLSDDSLILQIPLPLFRYVYVGFFLCVLLLQSLSI